MDNAIVMRKIANTLIPPESFTDINSNGGNLMVGSFSSYYLSCTFYYLLKMVME